MKSRHILLLTLAITVTSLVLFSLATAQDEDDTLSEVMQNSTESIQNQGDEILSGATRYVIEGSFNITMDGDVVEYIGNSISRWKRIEVPQLTLSDMPLIKVYIKPTDQDPAATAHMWRDAGEGLDSFPTTCVVYDEQSVLILYKKTILMWLRPL